MSFEFLYWNGRTSDELVFYTNSDYVRDLEDIKSIFGYPFLLSPRAISWSLKKQPVVSLLPQRQGLLLQLHVSDR